MVSKLDFGAIWAGAIDYADWVKTDSQNECPGYYNPGALGNVEYPFISITLGLLVPGGEYILGYYVWVK